MADGEIKYCPRCNAPFSCKVEDIHECQCNNISLSEAEREHIAGAYVDCLCLQCLLAIKEGLKSGAD